jgi:hypothetical protein
MISDCQPAVPRSPEPSEMTLYLPRICQLAADVAEFNRRFTSDEFAGKISNLSGTRARSSVLGSIELSVRYGLRGLKIAILAISRLFAAYQIQRALPR